MLIFMIIFMVIFMLMNSFVYNLSLFYMVKIVKFHNFIIIFIANFYYFYYYYMIEQNEIHIDCFMSFLC
jgi:hypothetical protein